MAPQNTIYAGVLSMKSASTNLPRTYTDDNLHLVGDPNALVVEGKMLKPGSPAFTLSGNTLSLATGGAIVIGGATTTLAFATSKFLSDGGAGASMPRILSGNGSNVAAFTGGAERVSPMRPLELFGMGILIWVLGFRT